MNEEPFDFKKFVDEKRVRLADYQITSLFVNPTLEIPTSLKDLELSEEQVSQLVLMVRNLLLSFNMYEIATLIVTGKVDFIKRIATLADIIEHPENHKGDLPESIDDLLDFERNEDDEGNDSLL
jgi:hypothetical protein